jgi:DNA-binding response OmpR family regulator
MNKPVLMIAEPDAEERSILRAILQLTGFEVRQALQRDQLIKLCWLTPPDLLLLDLALPQLEGTDDAVGLLRKDLALPSLPIVALTDKGVTSHIPVPNRSTVVLPKPVDFEKLSYLIDRLLPGRLSSLARSQCLS